MSKFINLELIEEVKGLYTFAEFLPENKKIDFSNKIDLIIGKISDSSFNKTKNIKSNIKIDSKDSNNYDNSIFDLVNFLLPISFSKIRILLWQS